MKKTMLRRGLAWLLVLVMTLSAVPFGVFAEEAPQSEGTSQVENGNPDQAPECTCAEQAKCTMETPNAACPVCSAEGADLDTCCQGKPQEQLDAEAAAKKAAEEEAAKKAAEEEAAKKAAEEEAAQKAREEAAQKAAEEETARKAADEAKKTAEEEEAAKKAAEEAARKASDEAVKSVQAQIDALPDAEAITAETRENVEAALTAIDGAKGKLTDEEFGKLDFARYDAAVKALGALDGTPGAEVPMTLEEAMPTKEDLVRSMVITNEAKSWGETGMHLLETYPGSGFLAAVVQSNESDFWFTTDGRLQWVPWEGGSNQLTLNNGLYCSFPDGHNNGEFILTVLDIRNYKPDGSGVFLYFAPFTVTFDSKDGSPVITQTTSLEGKLASLPEPTRTGFSFDGWYLDEQCTGTALDTDHVYVANTTVYAKWAPVTYTITFNSNGGSEVAPMPTGTDGKLTRLPEPTKEGYVFRGWMDDSENIASEATVFSADTTLKAIWAQFKSIGDVFPVLPLTKAHGDILLEDNYHDGNTVEVETSYKSQVELWYLGQKGKEALNAKAVQGFFFSIAVWKFTGDRTPVYNTGRTFWFDLTDYWFNTGGQIVFVREHKNGDEEPQLQILTRKDPAQLEDGVTEGWCWKDGRLYLVARYFSNFAMVAACPVVSFDSQGGTACTDAQVGIGGTLDSLPTPTRADYAFEGWYLDAACTGAALDTTHVYTADTIVYAKWKLTTDVQALIDALPDADTVTAENWRDAEKQLDPVRETVNGLEPEDRAALDLTRYDALAAAVDEQEAQERKRPPTKAELLNGGIWVRGSATPTGWDTGTLLKESAPGSGILAVVLNLTAGDFKLSKVGSWDFGWGAEVATTVSEKEVELVTRDGSANLQVPEELAGLDCIYVDTRNYNEADGTGLTLWLASAELPYTISFDSNGGSSSPAPLQTDSTGKLTALPDPGEKMGYAFDGWYHGSLRVDENTAYIADTELTAHWHRMTYTVTFDGNGGKVKNSVKTSETVSAVSGTEVTPPEFEKDYYRVSAWARNADGTGKVESPIKDLAAKDGDRITLYAVWEYAPRTVTFDADGGKITENKQAVASVTRTTQEDPINTLKATDLPVPDSREGWFFGGWYTQKDGKGDLVKAGSTEFKTDSTVYAYWIAFEPVTVTLKCRQGSMSVDGKNVTTATMQTKWPGVLDGTLPTPARTGYKFLGWYTAAGIKVDENTVFLKDTTLYARWVSAVSSSGNPRTGDQVRLGLAVGILAVAAVGLTAAIVIRKRKK